MTPPSGYIVDYSGDHAFVEGVETATVTDTAGNSDASVKVRLGNLSYTDLQGGVFGTSPGDVSIIVFLGTLSGAALEINGTIAVGGVTYAIVEIAEARPDGTQTRVIGRKQR